MTRAMGVLVGLLAALGIASSAAAQGRPAGRGPGGETETAGNNLSVPAIFVGDVTGAPALRVPCDMAPQAPSGPQSPEFPGYWLQQTAATWSASCLTADSATVTADWGDNLTTAPRISAGKPIRVEVGLLDPAATGLTGYVVDNLTPTVEDRNATYGTDGSTFTTGDLGAPPTRVWDPGAHLRIFDQTTQSTVFDGSMAAEINATGGVVYGYNWGSKGRVNSPAPGVYQLTFSTSDATTIDGIADLGGLNVPSFTSHSTSLTVTLTAGGGGGTHSGR